MKRKNLPRMIGYFTVAMEYDNKIKNEIQVTEILTSIFETGHQFLQMKEIDPRNIKTDS